ncbi:hypothetical protein CCP4SC76_5250002 [Gammaproteobacteria bacterium]
MVTFSASRASQMFKVGVEGYDLNPAHHPYLNRSFDPFDSRHPDFAQAETPELHRGILSDCHWSFRIIGTPYVTQQAAEAAEGNLAMIEAILSKLSVALLKHALIQG